MSIIDLFFSFKGRIGRLAYFGSTMVLILIEVVGVLTLNFIPQKLNSNSFSRVIPFIFNLGFGILGIVTWSSLAITAKRLHDRDKSGWWIFTVFIPAVGPILAIIELLFMGGIDSPNRFDTKTSEIKGIFKKSKLTEPGQIG
jgi:uncharacterized membrane protein YhaH (DUF805 family)